MNSRILIVGDSRRTARSLLMMLDAAALRDKGIEVQVVDQDEAARIAQAEDRRIEVSAEQVQKVLADRFEVAICTNHYDPVNVAQHSYLEPDRPAWVSPYGPARRGRRK
jgi:hypothetical protein